MIDLINKNNNNINEFLNKYSSLIEEYSLNEKPYIAQIIDLSINYIKSKYNNIDKDIKILAVLLNYKIYNEFKEKINNQEDIYNFIDKFFIYYKNKFTLYLDDLEWYLDDFNKNYGILQRFYNIEFKNNNINE